MFEAVNVSREIIGQGRNLLLCEDGSAPLSDMLAEYAGQAQCVYIDPPFMTGDSFTRRRRFGQAGWKTGRPAPEYPAYADQFDSREAYLAFLRELIGNAHQLLCRTGVLALHLDWRTSAYGRLICDEVFGEEFFLNEIIWSYESGGRAKKYFSRKHDTILLYARTKDYHFDLRRVPLERTEHRKNHMRRRVDEDGRAYSEIKTGGKVYRYYDDAPVYPGDVWTDISHLQQRDPERTGYATQKPVKLLDRILKPVVRDGDLVIDLCCGSGTAMEAAQALNCRYIGVDSCPEAILTTASRLESRDLLLECPCAMDDTRLEGMYTGEGGMMLLTGFSASHPSFPHTEQAMDTLEAWSAGHIVGDAFVVSESFRRTPRSPELPLFCLLPAGEGEPAISTVDAAGRRRVFRWVD
ncbi:MAG: site-specific DNA-methyltransferase [Clostridia bacterium]|nr:site-specific DNA-methyltransferase [Clostridia bacterium]